MLDDIDIALKIVEKIKRLTLQLRQRHIANDHAKVREVAKQIEELL